MSSLISFLDSYIFAGIPSNFVWDLIKKAWEKANEKTWDDLYIDSFITAFEILRPNFSKYADGDIRLDKQQLQKTLNQNLQINTDTKGLSVLTSDAFLTTVAKLFSEKKLIILGGNNLGQNDYEQLTFHLVNAAKSVFRQTIIRNELAFRQAVIADSKQSFDTMRELSGYLYKQFDITLVKLGGIEQNIDDQNIKLGRIESDLLAIKQKLEIDIPEHDLIAQIKIDFEKIQSSPMFETGGLCSGYPLIPRPNQYFIAQEFSSEREDLRQALSGALDEFGLQSIRADDFYWGGPILCKISAMILSTRFGVYQLTKSQNRNVYLELGIAVGQRKPFILIKDHDAMIPSLAQGLEYFPVNGYLELKFNLMEKANSTLAEIGRYKPREISFSDNQSKVIVAHGGGWDAVDFSVAIANLVQGYNLKPVLLNDPDGKISYYLNKLNIIHEIIGIDRGNRLDHVVNAIQSALFGIYRIDKESEADTFLSLGISMALNRQGLLFYKADPPSDLQGLNSLRYSSEKELKSSFQTQFGAILKRFPK